VFLLARIKLNDRIERLMLNSSGRVKFGPARCKFLERRRVADIAVGDGVLDEFAVFIEKTMVTSPGIDANRRALKVAGSVIHRLAAESDEKLCVPKRMAVTVNRRVLSLVNYFERDAAVFNSSRGKAA